MGHFTIFIRLLFVFYLLSIQILVSYNKNKLLTDSNGMPTVDGYFMLRGKGILYIVHLYFCVIVSQKVLHTVM